MPDIIYPAGLKFFKSGPKQPEWIIGSFVVTIDDLQAFIIDHPELLTEYNGKKQLKCQVCKGKDGPYVKVDTWRPNTQTTGNNTAESVASDQGDLPF